MYMLVYADGVEGFEKLVNKALQNGWELYGCVHYESGMWHQAVVQYEHVDNRWVVPPKEF